MFALQFADMQISELVTVFNAQVGSLCEPITIMPNITAMSLIDEFQRRDIDTTAVTGRKTISFAHPVKYDLPNNKLVVIN